MPSSLKPSSALSSICIALGFMSSSVFSSVVITEIDNNIDYIEITNTSGAAIDISGWTLNIQDDGLSDWSFTLDAGSVLAAGESFGVSDQAYFGAIDSNVNIPNSSSRGVNAYVTDDNAMLIDAIIVISGTDDGGIPPTNSPSFFGSIDWSTGDAVVRVDSPLFTADSFAIGAASPITSTSLTGTSSNTLSPISGTVAVPEVSSVCLFALASVGITLRRRRPIS